MKIKNNTLANLSVGALSTRGSADKQYLTVPGEATLEIDDKLWEKEFKDSAAGMLKAGNLVITQDVEKGEEEVQAEKDAALEAAKKLVAEDIAANKVKTKAAGKLEPKVANKLEPKAEG